MLGSASRQSRRSGHEVELSHWPTGVLALRHWLPCFLQPCMCCRLGAQHFLVSPDLRELWRLRGSVSIAARTAFGQYLEQIYRKLRGFKPKLLGQRATSRWWKRGSQPLNLSCFTPPLELGESEISNILRNYTFTGYHINNTIFTLLKTISAPKVRGHRHTQT